MRSHTKRAVAKVTAGPQLGTAFLVTDRLLLSAAHVVGDRQRLCMGQAAWYSPIHVNFEGEEGESQLARVVDEAWDASTDWVLLELSTPRADISPIPLATLSDGLTPKFEAFGYPVEHGKLTVAGEVRDADGEYFDTQAMQLYSSDTAAGMGHPLRGLSGAPCIVAGSAVGVVRAHPVGRFYVDTKNEFAAVKNGAMFACPISLIASRLPILPQPKVLTSAAIERANQYEEHIESFHSYQRALTRFATGTSYELAGQPLRMRTGKLLDLPGFVNDRADPSAAILVAEALESRRHVVVEAVAGAGKTSLLLLLACNAWTGPTEGRYIALYVHLRDLASCSGRNASERLSMAVVRHPSFAMGGVGIPCDVLVSWPELFDARIVLLLDGLDEVPENQRRDLLDWVVSLTDEYPQISTVLTTRDSALLNGTSLARSDVGGALYVGIAEPTLEQTEEIIRSSANIDAKELVQRATEAGLNELISTPLGASLAAIAYEVDGTLPDHRAGIYAKYVKVALNKARAGEEPQTLTSPQTQLVLEAMAWATTENPGHTSNSMLLIVRNAICEAAPSMSPRAAEAEAEAMLNRIGSTSGLIDRNLVWKHQTFREYLAARYIASRVEFNAMSAVPLVAKFEEARWRGVLLFLFNVWSDNSNRGPKASSELRRLYQIFQSEESSRGLWGWIVANVMRRSLRIPSIPRTPASATFFAELVIESRNAPDAVAISALDGLLTYQALIEETFRNWCRLLFSNEGKEEKRVLWRWSKQPRLASLLSPYICKWLDGLKTSQADAYGSVGLLILCGASEEIGKLLRSEAISDYACAGVVEASQRLDEFSPATENLVLPAIKLLLRRFETASAELSSLSDEVKEVMNPRFATATHSDVTVSTFMRRVRQYTGVLTRLEGYSQQDYPQQIVAGLMKIPDQDRLPLAASIATAHNPQFVTDVVLRSLSTSERTIAMNSQSLHPGLRRHIRRWLESSANSDTSPTLAIMEHFKSVNARLVSCTQSLELVARWASDDQFSATLRGDDAPIEAISILLSQEHERQHFDVLLAAGIDGSVRPAVRELILEALYSRNDLPEIRQPLIELISEKLSRNPNLLAVLRRRAELYIADDNFQGADDDASAVLAIEPNDGAALELRARARYCLGSHDSALRDIELAILSGEELGYRNYLRAHILSSLERSSEAIEALSEAERHEFSEARVRRLRAHCNYETCLLQEALVDTGWLLEANKEDYYALDLELAVYADLGRWQESRSRGKEHEAHLVGEQHWAHTCIQNAFGLGLADEFNDSLARLGTNPLGLFAQLLRLYQHRKITGAWSTTFVNELRDSLVDKPNIPIQFWLFVAQGDQTVVESIVAGLRVQNGENPVASTFRWIRCWASLFAPEAPTWAASLITELNAEQQFSPAEGPPIQVPPPPPLTESTRKARYRKLLFTNGMRCALAGIETYEQEKSISSDLLKAAKSPTGILIPLLDSGHIYMQTNVRWERGDPFDFKLCGDFELFKRHGVFNQAILEKKLQTVVVTDAKFYERLLFDPAFAKMSSRLACIPTPLPYVASEVEWVRT